MFLKTNIFKKLCRLAWKGSGLCFHNIDGVYVINGGFWQVEVGAEELTNPEKAVLIEIAGDMPEEGEHFQMNLVKKYNEKQTILEGAKIMDLDIRRFTRRAAVLPIVLTEGIEANVIRLKDTQECRLLPRIAFQMVTHEETEGVADPDGLLYDPADKSVMAYTNGLSTVYILSPGVKEDTWEHGFLEFLREIDTGERYAAE